MLINVNELSADLWMLLKRTGCRKRKVVLYNEVISSQKLYSYWDEGSRTQYVAYDKYYRRIDLPVGGAPGFTPEPPVWTPQDGDILIETGTFCGKPAIPVIITYHDPE